MDTTDAKIDQKPKKMTAKSAGQKFLFLYLIVAAIAGAATGSYGGDGLIAAADVVAHIFVSLLTLVSAPIILLSIISTFTSMGNFAEIKPLLMRVLKYTLITTVIAALVGLTLLVVIDPAGRMSTEVLTLDGDLPDVPVQQRSYLEHLLHIVPSNMLKPFIDGEITSILIIAIMLSVSILNIPSEQRILLHEFFSSFYSVMMNIVMFILKFIPIAVWAFVAQLTRELSGTQSVTGVLWYLVCVLGAGFIQAFIILPIFLKIKGVRVIELVRGVWPALSMAFFTKSSNGTLPATIQCAENIGIAKRLSQFVLPICATINMNGCAAFILVTGLFVSAYNGVEIGTFDLAIWVVIATIGAIGNAGVPMGCFSITSVILTAKGVPLHMMGVILPFYMFFDMFETAVNVWSDLCIAAVMNREDKSSLGDFG